MGTTPPTHACAVRFMNFGAETKFEKGASDRNSRPGDGDCHIMHRMQSGGWPYSEVGRDSSKTPSLRVAVLRAAVSSSLRNRRVFLYMHALIVVPRPLSVS